MYFNPRSPCGERPNAAAGRSAVFLISIHAPRVGSDLLLTCASVKACLFQSTLPVWGATHLLLHLFSRLHFNPRSPCGERLVETFNGEIDLTFQSTLPVWGATSNSAPLVAVHFYFNPRSPCGERLAIVQALPTIIEISIHAPRVGSDLIGRMPIISLTLFQSTLPVWGATSMEVLRD